MCPARTQGKHLRTPGRGSAAARRGSLLPVSFAVVDVLRGVWLLAEAR